MTAARAFLGDFLGHAGGAAVKAAVLVLLGAALEGLGLLILVPLLAIVFGQAPVPPGLPGIADRLMTLAGGGSAFERLAATLFLFCLLMLARLVVLWQRDLTLTKLQVGFVEHLRLRVAERLAAASWDQVARLRHARVVHVMSGDIQRVGAAAYFFQTGIVSVVLLTVQTAIAFLLSPALAALAVVLLAISAWSLLRTLRRLQGLGAQVTNAQLTLIESMSRFLGGLKLAAGQNLQHAFVGEFRATLSELAQRHLDTARHQTRTRLALTTAGALLAAVSILLGFGVLHLAPAVLSALVVIFARMSGPAAQLQQATQQVAHAVPAYAEIAALLAELPVNPPRTSTDSAVPDGPIVFDEVSFTHPADDRGREAGVVDLTLTLAPGAFVAVSGPSGAGKTTFADLLVGLLRPQSGTITIGGRALDEASLEAWRAELAYVAQDPYLFHDTVRRNLTWSNPAASEAEMGAALHRVGADRLVDHLPNRLDTIVGERGMLVSGGERQRLALARALLRRPRLLVLDEATNALDPAAEREIVEALRALTPRPTLVMIAHRSDSFAAFDRVLRLEDGRLGA